MRRFAQLVDQLDFFSNADDKVRLLGGYLRSVSDPQRGYGIGLLINSAGLGKVSVAALKEQLKTRIGEDRFDLLAELASDQVETLALGWPTVHPSNGAPALSDLIALLSSTDKQRRLTAICETLDHMEVTERWALIKCLTGRPPGGITPQQVRNVMAQLGGYEDGEIAQVWHGQDPPYLDLFAWLDGKSPRPPPRVSAAFRSFQAPQTVSISDLNASPDNEWACAWEPPGLAVEISSAKEETRLYTADGDDISVLFPEIFEENKQALPSTTLGYLTIPEGDGFQPTSIVKQRCARLRPDQKLTQSSPATFISFEDPEGQVLPAHSRLQRPYVFKTPNTEALLHSIAAENQDRPQWAQALLLFGRKELWPTKRLAFEPKRLKAVLLYAEFSGGAMKTLTFGAWRDGDLIPIGKARPPDNEAIQARLSDFISANTIEKFGPVREVAHKGDTGLVLEVSYGAIEPAPRRKAGLVLNDVNLEGVTQNETPGNAAQLKDLQPR